MHVFRHPKLADDIRVAAMHYAEISERVLTEFWLELELVIASIERNPRSHHYDSICNRVVCCSAPIFSLTLLLAFAVPAHDLISPSKFLEQEYFDYFCLL
jgi:hypothetical protein